MKKIVNGVVLDMSKEEEATIDTRTPDEVKEEKIAELSSACDSAIVQGINLTTEDGVERHFKCTTDDKIIVAAALELVKSGAPGYLYQDGDGTCFYASANDIRNIMSGFVQHVTKMQTYLSILSEYVKSLTDKQEVLSVQFGQELTGEWLVQFNKKMELASASLGGVDNG